MQQPEGHPAWQLEAQRLACGLVNIICVLSPQRIIIGGGVMQRAQLFPLIQQHVQSLLNGYVQHAAVLKHIDTYIIPPQLGERAGTSGALALARQAADSTRAK